MADNALFDADELSGRVRYGLDKFREYYERNITALTRTGIPFTEPETPQQRRERLLAPEAMMEALQKTESPDTDERAEGFGMIEEMQRVRYGNNGRAQTT